MKKLVLALALIASSTAMANISECEPLSKFGAPSEVASKAFFNKDDNTITVILNDGKSVSGDLVRVMNQGPTAIGFSAADVERTGLSVVVVVHDAQTYLFISPYMAMSIPQQLICKK